MRIKSDQFSNRVKTATGTRMVPPGQPFEVSRDVAREKIAAGRAEVWEEPSEQEAAAGDPDGSGEKPRESAPAAGPGAEAAGASDSGSESGPDPLEAIQTAILDLDPDQADAFLDDGRPNVKALSEKLGRPVSAAERDAAWSDLQTEA